MYMYINLDQQRRRAAVDEGARQAAVMDVVVWWCGVWWCGEVVWWYGDIYIYIYIWKHTYTYACKCQTPQEPNSKARTQKCDV